MARQTINIGTTANDGTGDAVRDAFDKANDNFAELYGNKLDASIIHAASGKTTPVDADEFGIVDSAASNVLKKLTWANLKAAILAALTSPTFESVTVSKNQNATTSLSLLNTDTTNSSSRATFTFQAGNISGRLLGINGSAFYLGTTSAASFIFQYNNANRLSLNDANIVAAVPMQLPSYTVAGVPSASTSGAGSMIYVSNESGGAVVAFSDGTNWRRVTDRATIT